MKKSKKAHKRLNMHDGFPFTSRWDMPTLMTEIRQAIVDWARDAETRMKGPTSP